MLYNAYITNKRYLLSAPKQNRYLTGGLCSINLITKTQTMKKLCLLPVLFLFVSFAKAQTLSPTAIVSTGGFSSNSNGSLSYSVGEMTMVKTFTGNGSILTQGFQQPNAENITGMINIKQEEFGSFVVYPNPAVDNLSFGFQLPEAGKVQVCLYNTTGQRVADVYSGNYENGKFVKQLDVTAYAAGVYLLSLNFVSDKGGKLHSLSQKFQVLN